MQFIACGKYPQNTSTANNSDSKLFINTRMWANAQRDGRPAEHRWRLLFNATKFG